jgi:hypothetical protein
LSGQIDQEDKLRFPDVTGEPITYSGITANRKAGMPLDYKDAEGIARELIAKIASEWKDTPNNRVVLENDSYVFILTLQESNELRLTTVDPNSPPSIVHFNPLAEAIEIVALIADEVEPSSKDSELFHSIIRLNAESRIRQMLFAAPGLFSDALWQLRIISNALVGVHWLTTFGSTVKARAVIETAISLIEEKIRRRFGPISKGRNPKIHDFALQTAMLGFLERFRSTGELPSRRKTAKALGVTPKAWRDFVQEHRKGDHELLVKEWLEELDKVYPK